MLAGALFAGSLIAGIALLHAIRPMLNSPALSRVNYAGRTLPVAAGILFPVVYVPAYVVVLLTESRATGARFGFRESMLLLVIGMCLLGLADDVAGDREASGFKGHFRALLKGRLTTGMVKAAGGFVLAMAASFPLSPRWWEVFLNAAVIALAANLANLLDLRPGRTLKVFVPLLAATAALNWREPRSVMPYLLSVEAVALVLLPGDLHERFMLGDAGSNVIGAAVGLGVAAGAGSWWKLGALAFLALANAVSEKYSFSRVIESNRVLNRIDSLGRKGHVANGDNNN